MKEKWLKDLHDRMADYEQDAPDMLWENIESRLIQNGTLKNSRHGFRLWKPLTAAAILLLIASVAVTFFLNNEDLNTPDKPVLAESSTATRDNHSAFKQTEPIKDTPTLRTYAKRHTASVSANIPKTQVISDTIINADIENHPVASNRNSTENSETKPTSPLYPHEYSERYHDNVAYNSPHSTRQKRFSFGVFASGMPDHSSTATTTTPFAASLGADNANWKGDPQTGIMLFNRGKNTKRNVHHNLPFRAGITFAYKINNRLSIESGLSYSMLSSDFTEGSESNFISTQQTLHYLGIPINLRYNFLSWNRLDFYASAGVIAEQCISAKQNTDYVLDNRIEKSETENIDEKPLQFSADISAGIQFNFSSLIGIYIEPGAVYHFKNRSELQTIYKDRPFDFNLNVGLRFTFSD